MNQHQANLNHINPVKTLRNDTSLAITAMDNSITYKELNMRLATIASHLESKGITDQHRVMIVGDSDNMIESICWTWGAMYLGASPGNSSIAQTEEAIQLKTTAGNCTAIVYLDGRVELVKDPDIITKHSPEEKYILYSSGTTKKKEGIYGVEPQFFTYHDTWEKGIAHIDQLLLAYKFLGEVPINELSCHPWEVAYAPHNVVQCLLSGGTYHYVDSPDKMIEAQAKYKTNLHSNYPLSYDPILLGQFDPPIEVVDVAGGICTPELIRRIRKTINPRIITNSFISSASGTILNRVIPFDDDPELCVWMEDPHINPTLKMRLDPNGMLWFKRNDAEWITDKDLFEKDGKYYRVIGKANDEFIQTNKGEISTWEVENFANQLTRTVWGCGEHTYAFAMNDGGLGLVYSGPLDIQLLKDRMDQMDECTRPDVIIQVKPEFWSLNIKVSRDFMADRLEKNVEYIVEKG